MRSCTRRLKRRRREVQVLELQPHPVLRMLLWRRCKLCRLSRSLHDYRLDIVECVRTWDDERRGRSSTILVRVPTCTLRRPETGNTPSHSLTFFTVVYTFSSSSSSSSSTSSSSSPTSSSCSSSPSSASGQPCSRAHVSTSRWPSWNA